jgi:hypothetical protein
LSLIETRVLPYTERMRALSWVLAVALFATGLPTSPAFAADRPARGHTASAQERGDAAAKMFLQGKYQEALAIYLDLYVTTARPEYLRNVARCQQKLKQYDHAIDNFKEYLRRAESLRAAERNEIQAYISEMQTARAQEQGTSQGAAAPAPPAPQQPATPAPAPPAPQQPSAGWQPAPSPVAPDQGGYPPPPPDSQATPADQNAAAGAYPPPGAGELQPPPYPPMPITPGPSVVIDKTPPPPPPAPRRSPLKAAGVAGLILGGALVVAGTAVLLASRSAFDQGKSMGCPMAGSSYCSEQADTVATMNTVSKVFYVAGGIAGAAGLTMVLMAPASTAPGDQHVGLGVRFRY